MKEQRKNIRFSILLEAITRTKGLLKKMRICDFSRDGLGVISDNYLEKGQEMDIEMFIPGDNIPIVVSGEIAWSTEDLKEKGVYKSGIKVKNMKDMDRGRILSLIYGKWLKKKG